MNVERSESINCVALDVVCIACYTGRDSECVFLRHAKLSVGVRTNHDVAMVVSLHGQPLSLRVGGINKARFSGNGNTIQDFLPTCFFVF
jgi:hypothetical protein